MKITFVVWAPYHRRPEILAEQLGASTAFIYFKSAGCRLSTLVRYLRQAFHTWQILHQQHPDLIFVQNPPIFSPLVVAIYARRFSAKYIIDSHTGAFISSKWRWSLGIHRLLSRAALATIVHNRSQEKIVREWGCRYLVIGFTPGTYPTGEAWHLSGKFNVAVVSSFRSDEPIECVFNSAANLPEVSFYVTGDSTSLAQDVLVKKPNNCFLTGYLSYEEYVGLLRCVDAIMVLTTSNNTLLMGAIEAVSIGTPLIVSDWPILRDYFSLGTVYVPNTAEGIREGVSQARRKKTVLEKEILVLREQLQNEWEQNFEELRKLL